MSGPPPPPPDSGIRRSHIPIRVPSGTYVPRRPSIWAVNRLQRSSGSSNSSINPQSVGTNIQNNGSGSGLDVKRSDGISPGESRLASSNESGGSGIRSGTSNTSDASVAAGTARGSGGTCTTGTASTTTRARLGTGTVDAIATSGGSTGAVHTPSATGATGTGTTSTTTRARLGTGKVDAIATSGGSTGTAFRSSATATTSTSAEAISSTDTRRSFDDSSDLYDDDTSRGVGSTPSHTCQQPISSSNPSISVGSSQMIPLSSEFDGKILRLLSEIKICIDECALGSDQIRDESIIHLRGKYTLGIRTIYDMFCLIKECRDDLVQSKEDIAGTKEKLDRENTRLEQLGKDLAEERAQLSDFKCELDYRKIDMVKKEADLERKMKLLVKGNEDLTRARESLTRDQANFNNEKRAATQSEEEKIVLGTLLEKMQALEVKYDTNHDSLTKQLGGNVGRLEQIRKLERRVQEVEVSNKGLVDMSKKLQIDHEEKNLLVTKCSDLEAELEKLKKSIESDQETPNKRRRTYSAAGTMLSEHDSQRLTTTQQWRSLVSRITDPLHEFTPIDETDMNLALAKVFECLVSATSLTRWMKFVSQGSAGNGRWKCLKTITTAGLGRADEIICSMSSCTNCKSICVQVRLVEEVFSLRVVMIE